MASVPGGALLFGGTDGSTVYNDTWFWNGGSWTQLFPTNVPGSRHSAQMAPFGTSLVLYGGLDYTSTLLSDTWTWNGSDWTLVSPAHNPGARARGGAASGAGTNSILFG